MVFSCEVIDAFGWERICAKIEVGKVSTVELEAVATMPKR